MQQFCKHNIKTGVAVQIQYIFCGWSYWIVLEISKTSNFYGCDIFQESFIFACHIPA